MRTHTHIEAHAQVLSPMVRLHLLRLGGGVDRRVRRDGHDYRAWQEEHKGRLTPCGSPQWCTDPGLSCLLPETPPVALQPAFNSCQWPGALTRALSPASWAATSGSRGVAGRACFMRELPLSLPQLPTQTPRSRIPARPAGFGTWFVKGRRRRLGVTCSAADSRFLGSIRVRMRM